jgi:hypothetical protein
MVKISDVEESGKNSVPYRLKRGMPYDAKTCRKFQLESGGAICENLRGFLAEKKQVLKTVIHSSNRHFHKILADYLLKVTKMRKDVLRDLI